MITSYKLQLIFILYMSASTIKNEVYQNIFTVTERGDRKIMEAHQHAIIFVGLTRVGKSTVFNWVLKKPMIGKGKLNSHYVPQVAQDSDVAVVGNSFASVTLAPNIYRDYEPKLSLVDMAGYEDTRNYVGVIGVSYFLKALFERVRKVKFVIVFDENKFMQQACAGLIKTFQGFINMFNFSSMSDVIKDKLKKSLSLVISRARFPQNHYEYIGQILQKMEDPTFLFDQKPLIIELLTQMKDSARMQAFQAAKDKKNPDECIFIPRFNTLGWQFFDLDQNQIQAGSSLISVPFSKDFQRLPQKEQDLFKEQLQLKVKNYLSYSDILKKLVQQLTQKWSQLYQTWKENNIFDFRNLRFDQLFKEVEKFVERNDLYNTKEVVSVELKVHYEAPSFIKSIDSILKLQEVVTTVSTLQEFQKVKKKVIDPVTKQERIEEVVCENSFHNAMQTFKTAFTEMIKILKIFATSQDEEILLERANFILRRGFREFQKLYELNKDLIHDIRVRLTDNCDSVFMVEHKNLPWNLEFIEKFVKKLDENLLIRLFPSLQALKQYQAFFAKYQTQRKRQADYQSSEEKDSSNIFCSEQKCMIQMTKADLLCNLTFKEKALHCYIKALRNISEISVCLSESSTFEVNEIEAELDRLSMKKLKVVQRIVSLLKNISEGDPKTHKNFALQLSKHHFMIDQTCQIYQLLIDSASNQEKAVLYQDYSDYCADWGRFEQARILLQKKLSIEKESFKNFSSIVGLLKAFENKKEEKSRTYAQNLGLIGRLKIGDQELDKILLRLEENVLSLIRLVEQKEELAKE